MYQTVPVTCPACKNRFVSPVLTLVDVSQNPEAKALLLSGQFNIAVCPQCGHAGMLSAPLVYHDPQKEILFTFIPSELGLPELEQQRVVGDLTNRVMFALPAEKRKGYLLRPRTFLRLEGMIETILEADGITPEMLQAQRARAALLDRLLRAPSEDTRRTITQENDPQIDYEFFQLLTLNIQLAQTEGREVIFQQLLELREQLLQWTTVGREIALREEALDELGTEVTREQLLEKLTAAALAGEQAKVETFVAVARPAIDYIFYQQLTSRIEAAEQANNQDAAKALRALREKILELTAQIDAQVKQATDQAARLLQRIMDSQDPEQAIQAHLAQIDDLFLSVLATNLHAAEQAGRVEEVAKLEQIGDLLLALIQESQPPEIQLINQLLAAEFPSGTQALLEDNVDQVDDGLLEVMQLVEKDLAANGRATLAQKLAQIQEQAAAMLA